MTTKITTDQRRDTGMAMVLLLLILYTSLKWKGLLFGAIGRSNLGACFTLRCFQRLSLPDFATQPCHGRDRLVHKRSVHLGPLVLETTPLKSPKPTPDRDRTVSRRSEPSSRTALMGEQPNPWNLLQLQDAMSRHRGAKPLRRCELLAAISLLIPGVPFIR